ncbi:hypothetical protein KJN74_01870 [Candidatus Bathyarchaeota archaeon]|nr:hypothetical protein [Candidatus Bathyarchaeota archaeon]
MLNTIRVKSWQQFKELVHSKNAKCIVYVIAQSIPSKNHTGLKLILPVKEGQYIFTDTAKGDIMRRTKISIHSGQKGNHFLTDEDVKHFLRTEFKKKELKIFSYWTA